MRVLQTGVQIIGGFLQTLPFQQRFGTLTEAQKWWFLLLVVLATMTTGLMLVPVSLHRRLFQHHVKDRLVAAGDMIVKTVVACVSLLIAGCAGLIFSVAVDPEAGLAAGGSILAALAALVLIYPLLSWSPRRKKPKREHASGKASKNPEP
ncbi:DUF6328 family protein [Arthrobacter sp. MMS18-M83]|uniref:DUF6328 family protein n=1 Tax=Arthrobacter sp. MMS18-M83 TaxID=2996261 RepID=UPI00227A2221|nr:DUF6328 family protein [Arthrobacter sp. MMS18-M83]WAH98246.1 DUF6328 family protein [Arthrobacter sp. MMS18-M83]